MSEIRASVPKKLWLSNANDPRRGQGYSYGSRPHVDVSSIPGHAQAMNSFREQQRTFYKIPGTPVSDFMRRLFRKG